MTDLIIVESPAKARTIGGFLGKGYKVVASKGHIRDLPISKFGIEIDEKSGDFIPQYTISKEASSTVKDLKSLAKDAQNIYIATDEDREGEAIGYHIATAIGKDPLSLPRIVFHEITKNAINHAMQNPRTIDMDSVNAQQTRRLLDRIVGYKLSPLLASKIQKGLSAGRVQSATLKLIVDKEREINAFESVEYWNINALFEKEIEASIISFKNEKIDKLSIKNENDAKNIEAIAKNDSFVVGEIDKKSKKTKTPPPFMTSTLQQSASTQLGFSPKKTMMIAQKLYEGVKTDKGTAGVITYMRTDSLNLSSEAVEKARDYIKTTFGDDYLPAKPKIYTTKSKGAQEAHEAIRPTMIDFDPTKASAYLSGDELKLYRLIYNRFLACQMNEAIIESQSIIFKGLKTSFKANGKKLLFDGFYKATGYNEKDKLLPNLTPNAPAILTEVIATQHFTEPPARYNEASLIKMLESLGIGRPSTYAPTITILDTRKYIEIKEKRIYPTEIANIVIELLEKHFAEIVDSGFTAQMEEKLDLIASNEQDWQQMLKDFYAPFMAKIDDGKKNIASQKTAIPTGEMCPECGSELLLRKGRFGEFVACGNFPKCKYTKNTNEQKDDIDKKVVTTNEICDKCGSPMVIKGSRRGEFLACSAYPKCKNAKPLNPPKQLTTPCPECGGLLQERNGKRGAFYGCTNYPKCKFISNIEPVDRKCSQCGYTMGVKKLKNKTVYECLKCKHKEEQ
ncbi:MAG: type I DNA topoisomerase [Sulfurovaceae bacterium]|nr:type I DNA topoisomerase [Sulfurovaceae bacterium]MDD5548835.1 type I DNA topoisomerase [Sulfurovaceae bacterium]